MQARRRALLALFVLSAVSCLPPKTYSTASGKPEVEFPGTSKAQIKDALVATMLNGGYSVKAGTDYTIVFEKPTTGLARLLTASRYDSESMYRVTYTLVDGSGSVRVQSRIATVTNPGSAFERVMDITDGKPGNELYAQLVALRNRFPSDAGHGAMAAVAATASPPAPLFQPASPAPATPPTRSSNPGERREDTPAPRSQSPSQTKTSATSRSVPESNERVAVAVVGAPTSDSARAAAVRVFADGKTSFARHEWGSAEGMFRQALRLDGSIAEYHAALGSVEMVLGKWEEAEAEYTAASLIDVNNSQYRSMILEARRRKPGVF